MDALLKGIISKYHDRWVVKGKDRFSDYTNIRKTASSEEAIGYMRKDNSDVNSCVDEIENHLNKELKQ